MLFKMPEMTPTNIRKLIIAFLTLLIISFVSLLYSSASNTVKQQGIELSSFAHSLQNRVDKYRYVSWQIFDSITHSQQAMDITEQPIEETALQTGVFSVATRSTRTETLIFGDHDQPTQRLAQHLSDYMETLWAPARQTWTLYYLNGEDNSLSVVTTNHLKERLSRFEGRNILATITARRNEMLQQANTLDERESFSGLRHNELVANGPYITVRTTFNQPGHLATILAVDLPLNDLNVNALNLAQIQIHNEESVAKKSAKPAYSLNLSAFSIDISRSLTSAPLSIVYHLPLAAILGTMVNELLPAYLILFALIALTATSLAFVHDNKIQPPNKVDPWVEKLQQFTQELIKNFPLGCLIYDAQQAKILLTNELSEHLVAHLNFKKMLDMSSNPFELLQVTVNNEIYQVRHHTSQVISHYHIFTFREQNREQLVDQQLQKAQALLDKNHKLRRQLFEQISETFSKPVNQIHGGLRSLPSSEQNTAVQQLHAGGRQLKRLVDNIRLLNTFEAGLLTVRREKFDLQEILDQIIENNQATVLEKGVELLVDNSQLTQAWRLGDASLIFQTIDTILTYSIENTVWGKIKLTLSEGKEDADQLLLEIVDTGPGISSEEQENADFPFVSPVSAKAIERSTSLDLFFCKQLLSAQQGTLHIDSKSHLGTRYQLHLSLPPLVEEAESAEPLLEDVKVLVDITADDVRHILCRQLDRWGAKSDFPEDRYSGHTTDLLITDNPEQLDDWGVLLTAGSEPPALGAHQRHANMNITRSVLDAIMSLIEQQIEEDVLSQGEEDVSTSLWANSEYYSIFEQTVREDIDKLYTEITLEDYSALALTAHRLKGVFAMLNLNAGKTRCESIESWIEQHHKTNIMNSISELHNYVSSLLQQGSQKNE